MPDPNRPLSAGKLAALKLLKEARDDAEDVGRDKWQFAIRKEALLARGASVSDLRWLVSCRLVEEACEITQPSDSERVFRDAPVLALREGDCFVLTHGGNVYVESHIEGANGIALDNKTLKPSRRAQKRRRRRGRKPSGEQHLNGQAPTSPGPLPDWHPIEGELYFRDDLVWRTGRKAAKLAELLIASFAPAWPEFVQNPFGDTAEGHQQLKEVVRRLNNSLRGSLLRFHIRRDGALASWEDCG